MLPRGVLNRPQTTEERSFSLTAVQHCRKRAVELIAVLSLSSDPMKRLYKHLLDAFTAVGSSTAFVAFFALMAVSVLAGMQIEAQELPTIDPPQYGPYNAIILAGGTGIREELKQTHDTLLQPDSPWTLSCWFRTHDAAGDLELIAGLGNVTEEYPRYLAVDAGKVALWEGPRNALTANTPLGVDTWHLLTATFHGRQEELYLDGVNVASGELALGTVTPVLQIGPPVLIPQQSEHFGGAVASFLVLRRALSAGEVKQLAMRPPDFKLLSFTEASKPWPFQTHAQAGYRNPQDPDQMPAGRGAFSAPVALKRLPPGESLRQSASAEWTFSDGWTMREAPLVAADGARVSTANYPGADWMRATVPGTVLTTLIDDGVYPDPYYGLNNLVIPETLNKQQYWYRNVFRVPDGMAHDPGDRVELSFAGINYAAEVWLNGSSLGTIKGAFLRGKFDVTGSLKAGAENVLAVKISPPPHPGIPQEQSIRGGPGENGGSMELDGPTFLATEGWDWLPAMRDRDSGIWQPVTLTVSGEAKLGDIQVLTSFRHHDTSSAAITLNVPVRNNSATPMEVVIDASIDSVSVHKVATVPPGESLVTLTPVEFPALNLQHPRLWWPNGYGKPELYTANIQLKTHHEVSDTRSLRFGVREITYQLSLLDATGHLRRVEFTPSEDLHASSPLIDVSHSGMREIASADAAALGVAEAQRSDYHYKTVVSSLPAGAEHSPAIESMPGDGTAPYLVIKVNGLRIAARGGNWGMDDARKRVSRERLEPYFRLHRDANLNIIRNWVGQNTEETFYELADEYGMMVWNDFWESTQDYNVEAEDPALFLRNAADVVQRYRNHPSIILWCGRNEGVPQPILNEGLEELVRTLDGTRFYSPSSNQVNLQQSGPYSYQEPPLYYTTLNRGFSVETGTPSMSTLESFESTTPKEDQWPMDDVWAYHDWHASGNGMTGPFMNAIESEFGAATDLADFERKAQMLNYVDHRAIFEGMNANLWQPNSGRLLWMTQPAWPSTMWQILSSDYDTQASFYATKKACEPLHVQLNLANDQVDVVNTTTSQQSVFVSAKVYSLATNGLLQSKSDHRVLPADEVSHSFFLELAPLLRHGMVLVELVLTDDGGRVLSKNVYWLGEKAASYRELNALAAAPVQVTASAASESGETIVHVELVNNGGGPALNTKLTLKDKDGKRILPAYFSENYVSLLAGEHQSLDVRFPSSLAKKEARIEVRGWNAVPTSTKVKLP